MLAGEYGSTTPGKAAESRLLPLPTPMVLPITNASLSRPCPNRCGIWHQSATLLSHANVSPPTTPTGNCLHNPIPEACQHVKFWDRMVRAVEKLLICPITLMRLPISIDDCSALEVVTYQVSSGLESKKVVANLDLSFQECLVR
jgi:hypothetical protein